MTCILFAIPQDVCNIICSELLIAEDIGRLDCAVLQEPLRTDWTRQLKHKTMSAVMNVGLKNLASRRYADFINWVCLRDAYLTELNLQHFLDVPSFRYDRVEAIRFTREVKTSLINKCINAKSIVAENVDYNTMGEVSSQIYEQCVSLKLVVSSIYNCHSLKELKIFCRMKHATTIAVVKQIPTLQKFYGNGNAEVLKAIFSHCKHLRECLTSIVSWGSDLYESGSDAALNDVVPVLEEFYVIWNNLYQFCMMHNDDLFTIKHNKYGKCLEIGKGFDNFHFLFKDIEVLILNKSINPTAIITQSKDILNRIQAEGVCCITLSKAIGVCSKLKLMELNFSNLNDIALHWTKIDKHINTLFLNWNTLNCSKDFPALITILENSMFDKVFCNCQTIDSDYDFHKLEEYWLHLKSKQRAITLGLFSSDKLVFGFTAKYKCVN